MSTTEVTMVYYGFRGLPVSQTFWMSMLALIFVASTVFPFMDWFNDVKHRVRPYSPRSCAIRTSLTPSCS